jgi:hypothetical protein
MKSASLRLLACLVCNLVVLWGTDSLAARGGGGRRGGGGGGHAISRGGGGRVGGMAGGGRSSAHVSRPAVSGGGFGGGGSRVASRPNSGSRTGGMVPKQNISGGSVKRSQAASKISSKGTGTGLPSVAQGKKKGAGVGGNKGFPDVGGKTGGGQVADRAQNAKGGQRAGKGQGGQLADKVQGGKGGQLAGKVQGAGGGQFASKLPGDNQGRLGNSGSPQRNQAVANRQQYWDKWGKDNQGKISQFQANRSKDWGGINNFRKNQNVANSFNKPEFNNYRNNVDNFRSNRSVEINNNIQNHFDNNFNDRWWGSSGWYRGPAYYGGNPWWWWGAATVATVTTFLALDAIHDATYQPPVYDYGVNVVYQGDEVYLDGQPAATAQEYSQQAIALANTPAEQPSPPAPPESGEPAEWLPMGVWALAQEEKGDAYMFFQISIDKNGVVSGAYQNVLSGEKAPISGQVDKKTQRVAWKIGSNNTVIETGLPNLTQDVASCLVHFGPDTTQTWLLVRLKQPEMPNAPQSASEEAKDS